MLNKKSYAWRHNMPPTCKLTITSHLFARWRCCSGITIFSYLFARWHFFPPCWLFKITSKLTFDLLTLKVVSESLVTWATSVPILDFLGLSVLELGPMYVTDNLWSATTGQLIMPRTRTAYGSRSFAVHGPVVWNSLPAELWSCDISLDVFRKQLKTFLFNCC